MGRIWKAVTLGALAVAMAAAVMLPAGASDDAPAAARCDEGRWPATAQGKPETLKPGGRAGHYVWHDSHGWHLRTTTPQHAPHPLTGTIVTSGDINLVHQFHDEGRDTVTVNGNKLSFSFVTYKGVDGVDFRVGCTESVGFSLKAFGRLVPATRIWLGKDGTARANPFRIPRAG